MGRPFFALLLFAFVAFAPPARAADANVVVAPPPAAAVVVAPAPAVASVVVTKPAPHVKYGCKRIWRCDQQVCEWRRGCWGIYGYMEGPYYSQELAQRQWERDGWPTSGLRAARGAGVHLDVAK